MAAPQQRRIQVLSQQQLSPHMVRICFGGDDLTDFPEDQESGYVKFLFDRRGNAICDRQDSDNERPLVRSYTIRTFDNSKKILSIDFALHGEHGEAGPASRWAKSAKAGDSILITGPGPKKLVDFDADWFFLVGDMTALPAVCVNLEQLPESARGYVVLEVTAENDIQTLKTPEGISIKWVINPRPGASPDTLMDKVTSLPFLEGTPSIWCAAEFSTMQALRHYFKTEKQVARQNIYISSYWKLGLSEEEHKKVKKQDNETNSN